MAIVILRLLVFSLAVCSTGVIAAAKDKARTPNPPSDSMLRRAIIRELGDPGEWGGDSKKIKYLSRRADLNGDGRAETLVWVPSVEYGGTGGYPLLIFRNEGRGLRLIGKFEQVWTPLIIARASRHGWRDVVMQMGGGGVPMGYVVFRHDGRRYPDAPREIVAARVRGRQLIGQEWQMSIVGPIPSKE